MLKRHARAGEAKSPVARQRDSAASGLNLTGPAAPNLISNLEFPISDLRNKNFTT